MVVTWNWLKEFVDFDLTPEELSHRLTMAGLEVDAMDKLGEGLDSVIVARLLDVGRHPDADRLTVCRVDTGNGEVQVVCGATNHKTGDLIALATVGTVLPGDFKIKESKIRGQLSQGMLCSEKELGLAEESAGIMILPAGLPLGQPVAEALKLADVRYELGLTPNRADCLSVVGVAREVAAMTGNPLKVPQPQLKETGPDINSQTSVEIVDSEKCPRYAARLIRKVKIGPSPNWLVRRLEAIGLRSINNVVDVTNYVMMELGHPLHAFDFNLLRGGKIVVRCPGKIEFKTLDGQNRKLTEADLAICDGEGPVALAGVMGGENSEIQSDTTDVLLESAWFEPYTVRRTSKRLGIHTDSSHRFERGADINMVPVALDRAAALIAELADGQICKGVIDAYPRRIDNRILTIGTERTNRILGLQLTTRRIAELLAAIGLDVAAGADASQLQVGVPTFRPDLEREIDLVEEVARLNGYDAIPVTMPSGSSTGHPEPAGQGVVRRLHELMINAGFSEVVNYSFVHPASDDRVLLAADDSRRNHTLVRNPLSEDQSVMRTLLLPSLLENVSRNLAYRSTELALYELRPVFLPVTDAELPDEPMHLAAVLTGRRAPLGWCQQDDAVDFFDLKGVVEQLLDALRIDKVQWVTDEPATYLHAGKSCRVMHGKVCLGEIGEVHPKVLANYDVAAPVFMLELNVSALAEAAQGHAAIEAISRYPDVYRDSAFLLDADVTAASIKEVVAGVRSNLVENIVIFDVYSGKGIPEGKKSVAVRVRYRSTERTLTDDEISKVHDRIVRSMEHRLDAQLR